MIYTRELIDFYRYIEILFIGYIGTINVIYVVLTILGYFVLRRLPPRSGLELEEMLMRSTLVPKISIISPAYNEAVSIHQSVQGLIGLEYPNVELIVVNDGSTDDTLGILIDKFKLFKSSRVLSDELESAPIRGAYESRDPVPLVVVDKENGGKADAINAGIRTSRGPLVAVVDADSLLEPRSLLYVVQPFLEDWERTVASGGIVRVANGCGVESGRVVEVRASGQILPLLQTIEYLRAFLGGRVAFSFLNSLLLISGAFGVFKRDVLVRAGGFLTSTVGEDMEVVTRMHALLRGEKDYRVVFVPDPVCWTEVPDSLRGLSRQRNRWQRGTVETLVKHRKMFFRRRYGVLGFFSMPYFALFELAGPALELFGYIFTLVGYFAGILSTEMALLFVVVSLLYSLLLSIGAVLLEDLTLRRYPSPTDVLRLLGGAVIENFGYRQLNTIWRVHGLVDALRGKGGWGAMKRTGFKPVSS